MNKIIVSRIPSLLCVALAVVLLGTVSVAQTASVSYYANANTPGVPDGTLRITNPGTTYANVCAMIYVFTADEQMAECCGCPESPDGLNTLSVNSDLTSNPLTNTIPTNGTITIVPAAVNASPCDPTANVSPEPDLREWVWNCQIPVRATIYCFEHRFLFFKLFTTELSALQAQCSFIQTLGSGRGICTCGTGGK